MSEAKTCPNCKGSGQLTDYRGMGTTIGIKVVSCHSCNGTGIVWSPDITQSNLYFELEQRVKAIEENLKTSEKGDENT